MSAFLASIAFMVIFVFVSVQILRIVASELVPVEKTVVYIHRDYPNYDWVIEKQTVDSVVLVCTFSGERLFVSNETFRLYYTPLE